MISVFGCSDYIQAQLLAGLLRQHGIDVFLQGDLLQGGVGELPAMGHFSIMVNDRDRTAAELASLEDPVVIRRILEQSAALASALMRRTE